MIAGYYRQKTQGLIISTSMHMMNNLLAFAAIALRSQGNLFFYFKRYLLVIIPICVILSW